MKKTIASALACAVLLVAANAWAHNFWINLTESMNHPPGHVNTILGFGHTLPFDDFLVGAHGAIQIAKYDLVDPAGKAFDLGKVDASPIKPTPTTSGAAIFQGDLGLRKIGLTPESVPGTYQVVAESMPMYITKYKNKAGKTKIAPKPIDAVKDMGELLESFRFQSFAKSFFGVKEWTEPKPLGHTLEILPLSDMSDIHVGDLVRFKVLFKGKPVNASSDFIATMNAESNTFGSPDGFKLASYIVNGEAQFRIPTAGQWLTSVLYQEKVEGNPAMKDYDGKCTVVFTTSSVGFTVKP